MKEFNQYNNENRRPDITAWKAAEAVGRGEDIQAIKRSRLPRTSASKDILAEPKNERTWNRLVWTGAGIMALLFVAGGAPVSAGESMRAHDVPASSGEAPSGFPVKSITSSVETFSTGNPEDMSIPRSEMTDPVYEPTQRFPGSVDGIPNPPGTINVLRSGQEAWVRADEDGHEKPHQTAFK